jgi:phosphotriesterase-related protein
MHINTVLGAIHPAELGACSIHEHLLYGPAGWQFLSEVATGFDPPRALASVLRGLIAFRQGGGRAVVDCSTPGFGRDPELAAALSRYSGVHVISCTGLPAEDDHLLYYAERDLDYVTEMLVHEITTGMGATAIRAGAIVVHGSRGELGPLEGRNHRAAARASAATGAAIVVLGWPVVDRQVRILLEEGAQPDRVVFAGLDPLDRGSAVRALDLLVQGFGVAFAADCRVGWRTSPRTALRRQARLAGRVVAAGYLDRLLLGSGSMGWDIGSAGRRGGPRGAFADLVGGLTRMLLEHGVTSHDMQALLTDNPRRLLSLDV